MLKTGIYTIGELSAKKEFKIMYGNETRERKKIVVLNGVMIHGVTVVKVRVLNGFVVCRFCSETGEVVAEHVMEVYEMLVIKIGKCNTYEYEFKTQKAG